MSRPTSKGYEAQLRPPERYIRLYGNGTPPGFGMTTAAPYPDNTERVGPQRVPRLFKPALAGWASISAPYWPPDQDNYPYGIIPPHVRPNTPGRADPRAVATGAVLRPATNGRVPPVIVPRARFSR